MGETMRYSKERVGRMIIDPYEDSRNIYDVYPQLKEVIEPFAHNLPDIEWHKYWRYLSFVYDPNSPMVKEYPQIEKRKEAARMEIGYEGEEHHMIAVEFIKRIVRNNTWTLYLNMSFVFSEYTDKLNKVINDAELDSDKVLRAVEMKNKMLDQQANMLPKMDEFLARLFEGDKGLEEAAGFVNYSAENIARKVKKK